MATIGVILFDADGVLQLSSDAGLSAQLERILGFVPSPLAAFTKEVFEVERAAMVGLTDFAEALRPVLDKWGSGAHAQKLADEWWCSIEADASLVELVRRLRRQGYLCALATNQQSYRAKYMAETLAYGTLFDRSFYSCQLGAVKPDTQYFRAVIEQLGCAPERALFIDDAEKNVAAAREAGLQSAQFVHPRNGAALASMLELLGRFGIVAASPIQHEAR